MTIPMRSLALAALLACSACISFAPWCVTKSGKHDCAAATAEMDSTYTADSTKADTTRKVP